MKNTRMHLETLAAEIEEHVAAAGWDQQPRLFAFARTAELATSEPSLAAKLGISADDSVSDQALTPVEQDQLPEGDIDSVLAQIAWPPTVAGCALSQEIVFLPPDAEAGLDDVTLAEQVSDHPERREARLTVAVLRDGTSASLLRLRHGDADDDLLVGENLAPNLLAALHATFED